MHEPSHALQGGGAAALAAALAIALVACHAAPQPALLSPLDESKRYGYIERTLGSDQIEVTYFGPRHSVAAFMPDPNDPEAQPARAEAIDLATWHAAEVAQARGFKGFHIVDRDAHVDSYAASFAPGSGMDPVPTWRYPGGLMYGPQSYAAPSTGYVQARATLTIALTNDLKPGDLDATDTIARLHAAYPGAQAASTAHTP